MSPRTPLDDGYVEFVCDQLDSIDGIMHKSMFGGHGLYCGQVFFGIVYRDALYLKTDEESRLQYLDWEMEPFQPNAKQQLSAYYQVPHDVAENREQLTRLAEEAIDVAYKSA